MADIVRERKGLYLLSNLVPGDRFYFAGDKQKNVYTLEDQPFENKRLYGYWIKFANCLPDKPKSIVYPTEQHKAARQVIFLRNKNDQQ